MTKKKQNLNTVTLGRLPKTSGRRFLFYAIGSEAGIRGILQAPAPWERLERMLATPAEMPGKGTVKKHEQKNSAALAGGPALVSGAATS